MKPVKNADHVASESRALRSLDGLSVGDGFGERFFAAPTDQTDQRRLPDAPWRWTDDTHTALSVVEVLLPRPKIDQDRLAQLFAASYSRQPGRGYGAGAHRLLARYARGADWRDEVPRVFEGGSYGTGAAMRVAPLGAFFVKDPDRAALEAEKSAGSTHAHSEGRTGAVAVAVAAALLSGYGQSLGNRLLAEVVEYVPDGRTRERVQEAMTIEAADHERAAARLGTGAQIAAFDTVPFCQWVAAHHAPDCETGLWQTVAGLEDHDTTCAIVGGIISHVAEVPAEWLQRREPLPPSFRHTGESEPSRLSG